MKAQRKILAAAVASALFGLTACGGSSSSDTSSTQDVTGVITGFGSVFVNGIEYETGNATVTVEGQQASERQLGVGMAVRLRARVNADGVTGVADAVEYADEMEGLVLANNFALDGTLNVMGQTVRVTADTVFESDVAGVTSVDLIVANSHVVEVSGYSDGSGNVYATRLEVKNQHQAGDEMEVKGVVTSLTATTFQLGDLIVDYSQAQFLPELSEGLYVEVKTNEAPVAEGTQYRITATYVELERNGEREMHGELGEEAELAGVVTSIDVAGNTFQLNGQTIRVQALPADDSEDDSIDLTRLSVGDVIEIEGRYDADGVFVAEEMEEGVEADSEYEGPVEAVDVAANTVTVLGQTFRVTTRTRLRDERDEGYTPEFYFNLGSLVVGDYVEVSAVFDAATGQRIAVSLERDNDSGSGQVSLHGTVENDNPLTIAGVSVDIATAAVQGAPVLYGEAEVSGTLSASTLVATEASFE